MMGVMDAITFVAVGLALGFMGGVEYSKWKIKTARRVAASNALWIAIVKKLKTNPRELWDPPTKH